MGRRPAHDALHIGGLAMATATAPAAMTAGQLAQAAYEAAIDPRVSAEDSRAIAALAALAYQAELDAS